ncbi:MAG: hypothetical protein R6U35_01730 [Candidatus Humimicrobiaceae bacterium]
MAKLDLTSKVNIISGVLLVLAAIIVFFMFYRELFLSVLLSEILVYGLFVATIYIYRYIYKKQDRKALQLTTFVFYGKLVFLGIMFFIITMFVPVNISAFFISFAILFTMFLGLEIIIIYKGMIFRK